MTYKKKNKTLKKGGSENEPGDFFQRMFTTGNNSRMDKIKYFNSSSDTFNKNILNNYNQKFGDSYKESDEKTNTICSQCENPTLNIFNLMKFFGYYRKNPNITQEEIIENIKTESKYIDKCNKKNIYCEGKSNLDEKKLNLCFICNQKYLETIYSELSVDVIPTLYIHQINNTSLLKDINFQEIDQNNRTSSLNKKTLYLYITFKTYNNLNIQWRENNDNVYIINLNFSEKKTKDDKTESEAYCRKAYISGPCSLDELLKAHINNVVMIILNSYKAGPNYGQNSNRVWYNKLMYYCDIDENVLLSNKKNILSEDKSYSENIKSKLKEMLNVKYLNKVITNKINEFYDIPNVSLTTFKKNKIKKPNIITNLSAYKEKLSEKEYKNIQEIIKKIETTSILERERKIQQKKSRYFHTITINKLIINHEEDLDEKNIEIRDYSPLNSFPDLTNKEQIIYFTPELLLYKSDLNNPILFDSSRKIEDKNLIEIFLDPNKLAILIDNIPKTQDRYTPICKGYEDENGKCNTDTLVKNLNKEDSPQRNIIINNINLILDILFDDKPINLSLSFDDLTVKSESKKKHYINNYKWNYNPPEDDQTSSDENEHPFNFETRKNNNFISNNNNNCIIEQTYEKDRYVLKCFLNVNLELMSDPEPNQYKKLKRSCLTRKQKIIKLLSDVFQLDDKKDGDYNEDMLAGIFKGFGLTLHDMLKETNLSKRKKRLTRRFLKNQK